MSAPRQLRVGSWNVNSLRVRLPQLTQWLASDPIDVLGMQEIKLTDDLYPEAEIAQLGFQSAWSGQKTYNGVALLAREPLLDVSRGIPEFDDPQRRVIAATVSGVRVIDVYIPNGQAVGSEKFAYKLDWLARFRAYLATELAQHERVLVVGDYNIAPDDRDVHDPAAWAGSVHVSPEERAALQAVLDLGFKDTFRLFEQPAGLFSWWDYRMGAFRRNHGLRIDLVIASPALAARCLSCRIERETRTWERPSDHAPVVASFDIS